MVHAPQLPNALTYTQDDFEEANSNLLFDAWRFRGSEHHLYPLYSHIFSLSCWNLRHPNQPRATLVSCPQPLFGKPPAAKTGAVSKKKTEPKAKGAKTKGEPKSKGEPKTKGDSQPEPNKKQRSRKQIPDFARIFVFSDDGDRLQGTGLSSTRELADFCELKVLNCNHPWWVTEAQHMAELELLEHLLQVYNAAMAGFAHNPTWKQVHAILIVGAFFTQVVWSKRPADDALQHLASPRVPKTIKADRAYDGVINGLLRQIPSFELRVTPDCIFHNAPVFEYNHSPESPTHPRVSLSTEFLCALDRPIKKLYPQLSPRSALFQPPTNQPRAPRGMNVSVLLHLHLYPWSLLDGIDPSADQISGPFQASLGRRPYRPCQGASACARIPFPRGRREASYALTAQLRGGPSVHRRRQERQVSATKPCTNAEEESQGDSCSARR